MKYELIKDINPKYNAIEQVLTNRGIPYNEIGHYLNTTDKDINSAEMLGEERLKTAATQLLTTIKNNKRMLVVVDSDCDGYTSSALLLNYLYDLFPSFILNNTKYYIHDGKEHGLSDVMEYIFEKDFDLVILPDSSSNDYGYHKELAEQGRKLIVLDHHEADYISPYATIINNQLSNYPNKELSGVGVTWQFCRYLDKLLQRNNADNYLDLVALGNCGDMMSLQSIETKHLINKGFKQVKNPFFYYMAEKNSFSLGSSLTPMGVAFYIVPFVNAMQRSGTLEEKELLFKSMLQYKAFDIIPSTKRGCKGQTEKLVEQAVRTATNVKNRQTRAQDDGMNFLERKIEEEHLLNHKVLLFLLKPGEVDKNIAGLIANKMMAKYQRPCCILTRTEIIREDIILTSNPPQPYKEVVYQGSARGCDKTGINNFKDICVSTGVISMAEGHQGAFGLGIPENQINTFLEETDKLLKDMSDEPIYFVDYIYKGVDVQPQNILDIASLNNLWGKDMDESLIAIEDLKVSKDMLTLMSPDKKPTLKITLPNKVALIKFGSSQEEYESLLSEGYISLNIVGKCNANTWMNYTTAQIYIEDYEIMGQAKYCF